MLRITEEGEFGNTAKPFAYAVDRTFLGYFILPVTRHLRAINAERYMNTGARSLDIGCGDGYFLRRCTKCKERFGLDMLLGDDIEDILDFPDKYFDCVTMLAVIEHLFEPEKVFNDIWRVLKPKGRLIITTPRRISEFLIRIYHPHIKDEHKSYFDMSRIRGLSGDKFCIIGSHTFLLGLNQVFCLEKRS
jgi:SAM-dependent methyltransferase